VEIEELKTDAQPGTATSGSLYTPLYTWDGENPTGNDVRTLTQEGMIAKLNSVGNETYYTVTCTNLASGAQLPQTGGAGTQRYILCGLVLLLAACGTAGSQSRRKHRAGKGAGAR
jgi:hypothetical protein